MIPRMIVLAILLFMLSIATGSNIERLCRICKKVYSMNSPLACVYHPGRWIGAEMSKHYGTRSGGYNKGLSLFWDCCDSEDVSCQGCKRGYHMSYDDFPDNLGRTMINMDPENNQTKST
jgi:hypothetical protein